MAPNPVIKHNLLQTCLGALILRKVHQNRHDFGFIFDLDAILMKGARAIPAARKTLLYLQHNNIPFVLMTDRAMNMEIPYSLTLREDLWLDTLSTDQVIQAHSPFKQLVPQFVNKIGLAIGRGDQEYLKYLARSYGFKRVVVPSDLSYAERVHISAILVWDTPEDIERDAQLVVDLLLSHKGRTGTISPINGYLQDSQPPIFYSNPDFDGFKHRINHLWTEKTNEVELNNQVLYGKKHVESLRYAELMLRKQHEKIHGTETKEIRKVFIVGDYGNIKGGTNEGASRRGADLVTCLVESSVHEAGTALDVVPRWVGQDVGCAVRHALRGEEWVDNEFLGDKDK
ncbi:uncharacterized protein PAC_04522 [Phialocephala subalpina]|uniref:Uncharacterized protein n=1 Tax=Phialocephala subalpina TaxID=576137 RepID=A0A1L7WPD7_9HELO|nr:uncharacterized protein PAC_04522 [Phialocephala subalpina]